MPCWHIVGVWSWIGVSTERKSFECCCSALKYWYLYPTCRTKLAQWEIVEKKFLLKKISLKNERVPEMESEELYMESCSPAVCSGGFWAGRENLAAGEIHYWMMEPHLSVIRRGRVFLFSGGLAPSAVCVSWRPRQEGFDGLQREIKEVAQKKTNLRGNPVWKCARLLLALCISAVSLQTPNSFTSACGTRGPRQMAANIRNPVFIY